MKFINESFLSVHKLGFSYANFNEYLSGLFLSRADLAALAGLTPRTLRRYCNDNAAPRWAYLVAFCAAGRLLGDEWQGWRLHNGGIVHPGSHSARHDSIKPSMLMDMGRFYERSAYLARTVADLQRENEALRRKLAIVDYKRLVPANVKPINKTISYERIARELK